ncbi:MAG: hypothetical protein MI684_09670 [Chlorobiales bacterium]|nr:hypothetical protein [Chlorobiales bacterium]
MRNVLFPAHEKQKPLFGKKREKTAGWKGMKEVYFTLIIYFYSLNLFQAVI